VNGSTYTVFCSFAYSTPRCVIISLFANFGSLLVWFKINNTLIYTGRKSSVSSLVTMMPSHKPPPQENGGKIGLGGSNSNSNGGTADLEEHPALIGRHASVGDTPLTLPPARSKSITATTPTGIEGTSAPSAAVARGLGFDSIASSGAVNGGSPSTVHTPPNVPVAPSAPDAAVAHPAGAVVAPMAPSTSFPGRFGAGVGGAPHSRPNQPRSYADMGLPSQHSAGAAAAAAVAAVPPGAPRVFGGGAPTPAGNSAATYPQSKLPSQPVASVGAAPPRAPVPPGGLSSSAAARSPPNAPGGAVGLGAPPPAARPGPPAASAPPAPQPAPPARGGMRELRVEDALLYLDDVKREFGDRPRVYNEFLAIMKNFKSQEVDTPGVIARVSTLFRGYNNLILGFNKFLPDGYKISLEDLQAQDRKRAMEEERAFDEQARMPTTGAASGPGAGRPSPLPSGTAQGTQRPSRAPTAAPQGPAQGAALGYPHQQAPQRAQQQAAQKIPKARGLTTTTPPQAAPPVKKGPQSKSPAMSQTQQTFRKSPPTEKIDPRGPPPSQQKQQPHPSIGAPVRPGLKAAALPGHKSTSQARPGGAKSQQLQSRQPGQEKAPPPVIAQASRPQPGPAAAAPQHQPVEFDHAISYVTTIKKRFGGDPSTYHAFLEILHTYQKEQRGIKEVLEQVAHLFQDHPDLLKEFTFFLPDAIQEQAKERLHRAAADSEARLAAERSRLEQLQHHHARAKARDEDEQVEDMDVEYSGKDNGHQKFIDMTSSQKAPSAEPEPEPSSSSSSSSRGRKRPIAESTTKEAPVQLALPLQPESYVYNSAVERQFFDAAREALASYSRDGGQAWAEFLKCLDMYAQEILSRSEMLTYVEQLLGKRNTKLCEEFKRILAAAGAQQGSFPSMEDSWHSVPLSEIDFSRCRRCSPSYRALPRDYPAPPCSDRSDEESKVLNDIWVSLPVGSEESYTFRHMRRNTYEETLFRCEDERFEIDMVIDSNLATLYRLEPLAEEIAQLAQEELVMPDNSNIPKPGSEGVGMGGKRFQYKFDKNILGVIHRNSIARLYGDAGQEMLDLLVKNPTVAIPVVVQRLSQKDKEWRIVRERLNRRWKELVQHNYYRSLDHRSLTWRTTDKRAISTRTLVGEIKDRASHGGNEGAASLQARMDKAKEEHGTFYEITMRDAMTRKLDATTLPKPDRRLFTPHLSMMYENNNWAQRDAYRILAFALERGSNISPSDKERCHRLWTDFLGPWFGLSLTWMQLPAVAYQENVATRTPSELPHHSPVASSLLAGENDSIIEEEDDESMDDDDLGAANVVTEDARKLNRARHDHDDASCIIAQHPIPSGATISTIYGPGKVLECRRSDDAYVVQLPFGKAYLRPASILCTVFNAEKSAYTSQLRAEDRSKLERTDDMLAIGPQSLYLFFRLHQILVRRLGIAKELAFSIKDDVSLTTLVEQMPGDDGAALGRRRYDAYLSLVYALIDGGASISGGGAAEGGKYEDRVRCLLGHGAYELATMDKLISHILKNLQSMGNDDTMWNMIQLFRRHLDSPGSFKPDAFRQEASYLSEGEIMYAFQQCPVHSKDGDGNKSVLHFEYLGVIAESEDDDLPQQQQQQHQQNHGAVSAGGGGIMDLEDHPPAPEKKRPKRER
jgi:paired amphipathic helix protein Sin3a